jgi:DHA1 family bicyclomycin/chloramphenicol resistance-like MFS transporter
MKEKLLLIFLVVTCAFTPLTTEMYLPGLPTIAAEFGATDAEANMTIILFFIAYGCSSLAWGPLSDKYGRRPILIAGFIMYFTGSLLSALTGTIEGMFVWRILQGIGCGNSMSVASAVARDVFTGRRLEKILSIIQSMVMLGPVVAPVIGAFIIDISGWRSVFFLQAVIGIVMFIGALIYKETLKQKNDSGVLRTLARIGVLMKQGTFAAIIVLFALSGAAVLAHISASPYIYQEHFGFDYYRYSIFFAASSAGAVLGPALYVAFSRKRSRFSVEMVSFAGLTAVGMFAFFFGELSPWLFVVLMFLLNMFTSMARPGGSYLALNYYERDTGAASSLFSSSLSITSALGMALVTLSPRYILSIGIIAMAVGIAGVFLWYAISRRYDVG